MMLHWISSVPPAIEVAGTNTSISVITPFNGPSLPVSMASAPEIMVCTCAAMGISKTNAILAAALATRNPGLHLCGISAWPTGVPCKPLELITLMRRNIGVGVQREAILATRSPIEPVLDYI